MLINTAFFRPENLLAIGAVLLFWSCVAYAVNDIFAVQA